VSGGAPDDPAELLRLLRSECRLGLATLTPAPGGESGAAFWVSDQAGIVSLLKIMPGPAPAALDYLRVLGATVGRLREREYPAPRFRAVGQAAGFAFWIQERMAGTTLDSAARRPDGGRTARLLPALIRLNDAQAGLGRDGADQGSDRAGQPSWPALIQATLAEGGDGYCVHATLRARPDTRDLLDVLRRIGDTCAWPGWSPRISVTAARAQARSGPADPLLPAARQPELTRSGAPSFITPRRSGRPTRILRASTCRGCDGRASC
jgi:hypothetical protein